MRKQFNINLGDLTDRKYIENEFFPVYTSYMVHWKRGLYAEWLRESWGNKIKQSFQLSILTYTD